MRCSRSGSSQVAKPLSSMAMPALAWRFGHNSSLTCFFQCQPDSKTAGFTRSPRTHLIDGHLPAE